MASLYLVRLGETENNVNGIWSGRMADSPLTPKGKEQSETVSKFLTTKKISSIYSSPSKRVVETAQYLAKAAKLPIVTTNEFQEIDLGDFDGLSSEAAKVTAIGSEFVNDPSNVNLPGALESLEDTQKNAVARIKSILAENADSNIAIYSHGATMRLILLGLLGIGPNLSCFWRFRIGNTAVVHLVHKNGQFELQELINFGGLVL